MDEKRAICRSEIQRAADAGITKWKFRFGNMLAGHCSYSLAMDEKRVPKSEVEFLPAPTCEHPDQCGCRWQAWMDLMDEID